MNRKGAKKHETTLVESCRFPPFLFSRFVHSFLLELTNTLSMPSSSTAAVSGAAYRREVGARLRRVRLALGPNAAALAAEFGVTGPRWSHWENGRHLADVRIMVRLSRRYGVTLDYLYKGDESGLPRRLSDAIRQQPDITER